MKYLTLALAVSALAITGCSLTPSPHQLASQNNWEQLGQLDGHKGLLKRTNAELSELNPLSSQQFELYNKGYTSGITEFCTPQAGYFMGVSGFSYNGQCADFEHEQEYILSWQDGQFEYDNARWEQNAQHYEYEMYYNGEQF